MNNGNARVFSSLFSQFYLLIDAYTYRYHFIHFLRLCVPRVHKPPLSSVLLAIYLLRSDVMLCCYWCHLQHSIQQIDFSNCQNDHAVNTNVDGNNHHFGRVPILGFARLLLRFGFFVWDLFFFLLSSYSHTYKLCLDK